MRRDCTFRPSRQTLLQLFGQLRETRDWDKAQEIINLLVQRFPTDQEIKETQVDFGQQRRFLDTVLMESHIAVNSSVIA